MPSAKKSSKKSTGKSVTPGRYTVMQVAKTLGCRYQRARDLMLAGNFGEADYDDNRKLTVDAATVVEYKKTKDAEKQSKVASA